MVSWLHPTWYSHLQLLTIYNSHNGIAVQVEHVWQNSPINFANNMLKLHLHSSFVRKRPIALPLATLLIDIQCRSNQDFYICQLRFEKNWNLQHFIQYLSPNSLFEPHSQSIWSCFYQDTTKIEFHCRVPYTSNTILYSYFYR